MNGRQARLKKVEDKLWTDRRDFIKFQERPERDRCWNFVPLLKRERERGQNEEQQNLISYLLAEIQLYKISF
jgi:hypothetical protein